MKHETSRSEGQIANGRQLEMNYNESVGTIQTTVEVAVCKAEAEYFSA
jgi:hypothetical protein